MAEWLRRGPPPIISGRPRVLFPDDSAMRVCPETVYRWIHADRHRRERWARCLPRGHRRRRRRGGGRTSRFPIPGRVPIPERPPEAGDRSGFGHWEADSVIGAGCNPHTEVERKTRFLMAGIVPGKTAGESVGAQPAMFSPLPAGARGGVTHDNGTEFARHTRLRDEPGMDTYFADPYSSRRRGSNENRNGMIRRYPPERSEIRMDMAGELREIVDEADNRPMRVLGYRTPAEAFADEPLELQDQQGCCTSKSTTGAYCGENWIYRANVTQIIEEHGISVTVQRQNAGTARRIVTQCIGLNLGGRLPHAPNHNPHSCNQASPPGLKPMRHLRP